MGHIAPRPRNVPLASERGSIMPTLEQAIESYLAQCLALPVEPNDRGCAVEVHSAVALAMAA
jgi:hypothetical protein